MKERLFNLYTFYFVLFLASDRLVYFLFIYLFIYLFFAAQKNPVHWALSQFFFQRN